MFCPGLNLLSIEFQNYTDTASETEEDEGVGCTCPSEESEGGDSGFICVDLRFVPLVDTSVDGADDPGIPVPTSTPMDPTNTSISGLTVTVSLFWIVRRVTHRLMIVVLS